MIGVKAFIVTDNDGIIVGTYKIEGHARRFCKDRGYSYEEYQTTDVADYWRTRCELAEECLEQSPCDTDITRRQIEANNAYCNFIANNDAPLNYQVIGTAEMVQNQPTGYHQNINKPTGYHENLNK